MKILAVLMISSVALAAEPSVTIADKDATYRTLAEALESATDGDTLEISGTHEGNFKITRPLTLSGTEGAKLDGGGKGTVLLITAAGVTVENLAVSNSGRDRNSNLLWGPAGIRVAGNRAMLRGLEVSDCEWGVIFFGGADSRMEGSLVENNHRVGVKVMGGKKHRITGNRIHRNQLGVLVDSRYGDATEMVLPSWTDMAQIRRLKTFLDGATHSERVVVADNEVRGNGMVGIHVFSQSKDVEVSGNSVSLTGRETKPDLETMKSFTAVIGAALGIGSEELEANATRHLGSGILVYCGPSGTRVLENRCDRNEGFGIGLRCTDDNEVARNVVTQNAIGIFLDRASNSSICGNQISGNRHYGIAVEPGEVPRMGKRSTGNVIFGNTLRGNDTNAFDGSGKIFTAGELEKAMIANPPPGMKDHLANPAMRRRLVDGAVKRQKPGSNRWDDGKRGNYYDDFDEKAEGFEDADGDGVGEKPRPIPGGDASDRFPLAVPSK